MLFFGTLHSNGYIFPFLLCLSVQLSSVTQSCLTLCNPMNRSTPGLPVHHQSWSLPKLMSIELVMSSNHLILCHPLLFLPSIFPSISIFSSESALHIRWPKHCNFSFNISPSNEYPGLISFRMDWFRSYLNGLVVSPSFFIPSAIRKSLPLVASKFCGVGEDC